MLDADGLVKLDPSTVQKWMVELSELAHQGHDNAPEVPELSPGVLGHFLVPALLDTLICTIEDPRERIIAVHDFLRALIHVALECRDMYASVNKLETH